MFLTLFDSIPGPAWGFIGGLFMTIVTYLTVVKQLKSKDTEIAIASVEILLKPLKERIEEQNEQIKKQSGQIKNQNEQIEKQSETIRELKQAIEDWELMHKKREGIHKAEATRLRKRIKELENEVAKLTADKNN